MTTPVVDSLTAHQPIAPRLRRFLLLALLCTALPAMADCSGEPWVTLEIIAGEIAGNEVAEWVEIDQQGCVISRYGDFDRRRGVYQRQMPAQERAALGQLIRDTGMLTFDARAERAHLLASDARAKASGQPTLFAISDADIHRLQIHEGKAHQLIEWRAPELEARQRKTSQPLQRLVSVIRAIRAIGADSRRQKIAEVTP